MEVLPTVIDVRLRSRLKYDRGVTDHIHFDLYPEDVNTLQLSRTDPEQAILYITSSTTRTTLWNWAHLFMCYGGHKQVLDKIFQPLRPILMGQEGHVSPLHFYCFPTAVMKLAILYVKDRRHIQYIRDQLPYLGPLHYQDLCKAAVYYGRHRLIELLIQYDLFQVNFVYPEHVSLLTLAVSSVKPSPFNFTEKRKDKRVIGSERVVNLLLQAGALVDGTAQDRTHSTPLHWCVQTRKSKFPIKEKLKIVKLLLENGANPNRRDGRHRCTLQLMFMWCKSVHLCDLLLQYGAAVNSPITNERHTVLEIALLNNASCTLLQMVKDAGANDTNSVSLFECLFSSWVRKKTNVLDKLKLLHSWGYSLRYAVPIAIYHKISDILAVMDYVLEHEPNIEPDRTGSESGTLVNLELSVLEIALRFFMKYTERNEDDGLCNTSRFQAVRKGVFQRLVAAGVDVNALNLDGNMTMLEVAAKYNPPFIPLLMAAHLDVTQVGTPGKNAVYYLINYWDELAVKYIDCLLDRGILLQPEWIRLADFNCVESILHKYMDIQFRHYFKGVTKRYVLPLIPLHSAIVKLQDSQFVGELIQAKYSGKLPNPVKLKEKFGVDAVTLQDLQYFTDNQ